MNILLVEDSKTLRHAMTSYIRNAGHTPVVAESGEEALQIAEHASIDMIIMDVEMPGLDGFETTRLIREWLGDHWIPIIFVTGKNEEADLKEGIEAGGDDYLIKPVSQAILHAKIRAMERITAMRDQLAQMNRELTQLSQTDGLTQLLNRRTFEAKAEELWRQASRNKQPLAVILIDVDYFKLYNDYYGHPAGDECLRRVAALLAECVSRPSDIVGRYGGEEFVILLTNTPEDGALHVAEEIRQKVEGLYIKHRASPSDTKVTLSMGVSATHYTTGTTLSKQISRADKALYAAKQAGRNRVQLDRFNPHGCVLVLETDNDTLKQINSHLSGHCGIVTATSNEECLQIAEEVHPDVVLLRVDPNAPKSVADCKAACTALRSNALTANIGVAVFAYCSKDVLERVTKQIGADACLNRPGDAHQLIALVDQFLR
jgi:diguanylate cyclase (GGDEF)-like protein